MPVATTLGAVGSRPFASINWDIDKPWTRTLWVNVPRNSTGVLWSVTDPNGGRGISVSVRSDDADVVLTVRVRHSGGPAAVPLETIPATEVDADWRSSVLPAREWRAVTLQYAKPTLTVLTEGLPRATLDVNLTPLKNMVTRDNLACRIPDVTAPLGLVFADDRIWQRVLPTPELRSDVQERPVQAPALLLSHTPMELALVDEIVGPWGTQLGFEALREPVPQLVPYRPSPVERAVSRQARHLPRPRPRT